MKSEKRRNKGERRTNSEKNFIRHSFEEMREQLGMEGDWDEIGVTDTDNREFVLQDVIEEFYDLMIEKVLNYIGAE